MAIERVGDGSTERTIQSRIRTGPSFRRLLLRPQRARRVALLRTVDGVWWGGDARGRLEAWPTRAQAAQAAYK